MKILVPGGSGHLGTLVANYFFHAGHDVVVLSRNPQSHPWKTVGWDGRSLGTWVSELEDTDVVINLAGRSVDCRYHAKNRSVILNSRIESTRILGQAIETATKPPPIWLQMSTATYYAHSYGPGQTEEKGILGGNEPGIPDSWKFSIEVARAWEKEATVRNLPHTRLVLLRTAMVMSPYPGGVFQILKRLSHMGLGGRAGSGRQFVSWMHYFDFLRAIDWLIANAMEGVVNLCSPHPLPNAQFMKALRQQLGNSMGLPAPRWILEIGSFLMRTESELLLKSRCVIPQRLQEGGFEFLFPNWKDALMDLSTKQSFDPLASLPQANL